MADNITVTQGAGTTMATDDVGPGVQYPRVKISWGVDGSAIDASASNPFPVVQTGTLALPTGAATAAKQPALGTAGTASTDVITVQGIASMTPILVNGSAVTQPASLAPATSGGLLISKAVSTASTNATSAKGSAGQVFGCSLSNVNAAPRYLKLYNKATAPTVGSDTPVMTIIIPGNTAGAGNNWMNDVGITFSTGIAWALTTEATDAGSTGVAANEIVVNLYYK